MKSQLIVVAAALVIATMLFQMSPATQKTQLVQFEQFQRDFGRIYTAEQKIFRFNIFARNLELIEKHNADSTQTYTIGVTQFADMTEEEFIGAILMKDLSEQVSKYAKPTHFLGSSTVQAVDWRDKGVITPVKNQGSCGSCWAFSTTGVLESSIAVAKGDLLSFSEQQLVDCCGDKGYQCQGCNGAWPEWAMNYINADGIVQESEYAYKGTKQACKASPTAKKYLNSGKPWQMVAGIESIQASIAASGPVSVCLDASKWSLYRSGVFTNCGTTVLNHAVLAVGYQADGTWIVKNSWGGSWGEQGFIRLGTGNTCGIANHVVVPNLA